MRRALLQQGESPLLTENGRKYVYRKWLIAGLFLFFAVLATAVWLYFTPAVPFRGSTRVRSHYRNYRTFFLVLVLIFPIYRLPERMNRYVILYDTWLHCHSFRFFKRQLAAKSLNMRYQEIYRLDYRKRCGVFEYLYIYENSLPQPVKLSYTLRRHRDLFARLCLLVEATNPAAAIAPELKALADARRETTFLR